MPWETCKAKWKNIRDYFGVVRKKLKNSKKSGSGATTVNKGNFYDRLQFLVSYVAEGKTVSSFETSSASLSGASDASDEDEEDHSDDPTGLSDDQDDDDETMESDADETSDEQQASRDTVQPRRKRDGSTDDVSDKRKRDRANDDVSNKRKRDRSTDDVSNKRKRDRSTDEKKPSKSPGTKRDKKMAGLLAKLEKDYDEEGKKLEELQQNIGTRKSTFYSMMEEKMGDFPKRDQVWMEAKVWGLYMELQAKHQQLHVSPTVTAQKPQPQQLHVASASTARMSQPPHQQLHVASIGEDFATQPPQYTTLNTVRPQDMDKNSFNFLTSCLGDVYDTGTL